MGFPWNTLESFKDLIQHDFFQIFSEAVPYRRGTRRAKCLGPDQCRHLVVNLTRHPCSGALTSGLVEPLERVRSSVKQTVYFQAGDQFMNQISSAKQC